MLLDMEMSSESCSSVRGETAEAPGFGRLAIGLWMGYNLSLVFLCHVERTTDVYYNKSGKRKRSLQLAWHEMQPSLGAQGRCRALLVDSRSVQDSEPQGCDNAARSQVWFPDFLGFASHHTDFGESHFPYGLHNKEGEFITTLPLMSSEALCMRKPGTSMFKAVPACPWLAKKNLEDAVGCHGGGLGGNCDDTDSDCLAHRGERQNRAPGGPAAGGAKGSELQPLLAQRWQVRKILDKSNRISLYSKDRRLL